jgi:ADP-ribosylglycohydrolase
MIGAIAGDIIGSVYEHRQIKTTRFPLFDRRCRFTDDSVMTIAVAAAILEGAPYGPALKRFGRRYPDAGYGSAFYDWLFQDEIMPYHSWGNGSAMRASPIGLAFDTPERVLAEARRSAEVSHNHPEGIKGAQAAALAVYLARQGESKDAIRLEIAGRFGYALDRTVESIRPGYKFDVSCQGTVPEALIAFFDANSYEDAVRNAISLGGDSDTLACIAGGVAQAFYGSIPAEITAKAVALLPPDLLEIVEEFNRVYHIKF